MTQKTLKKEENSTQPHGKTEIAGIEEKFDLFVFYDFFHFLVSFWREL
jgi:hypothetical protein